MGDDDEVTHGGDVGPEESTTDIEWTVINLLPLTNIALPNVQGQTDFSITGTSCMMTKVRSDTVITCIGSRVQENVLEFGQNHKHSPYFGCIFGHLTPLSA